MKYGRLTVFCRIDVAAGGACHFHVEFIGSKSIPMSRSPSAPGLILSEAFWDVRVSLSTLTWRASASRAAACPSRYAPTQTSRADRYPIRSCAHPSRMPGARFCPTSSIKAVRTGCAKTLSPATGRRDARATPSLRSRSSDHWAAADGRDRARGPNRAAHQVHAMRWPLGRSADRLGPQANPLDGASAQSEARSQ